MHPCGMHVARRFHADPCMCMLVAAHASPLGSPDGYEGVESPKEVCSLLLWGEATEPGRHAGVSASEPLAPSL
jgi:hypothetical protein